MDDLLTVAQAAELAGAKPQWVRLMAQRGRIPGARLVGSDNPRRGVWLIPRAGLDFWMTHDRDRKKIAGAAAKLRKEAAAARGRGRPRKPVEPVKPAE